MNIWNQLINHYKGEGYELEYHRLNDFATFFEGFPSDNIPVTEGDQLEVGEKVTICNDNGSITIDRSLYYKRGYLWSGSAQTVASKGNIWAYGDSIQLPLPI